MMLWLTNENVREQCTTWIDVIQDRSTMKKT
jgi:hypothetical protein